MVKLQNNLSICQCKQSLNWWQWKLTFFSKKLIVTLEKFGNIYLKTKANYILATSLCVLNLQEHYWLPGAVLRGCCKQYWQGTMKIITEL